MFNDMGFETGIDFDAMLAAVEAAGKLLEAAHGGRIVPWSRTRRRARAE
jgi:hypothetical protein